MIDTFNALADDMRDKNSESETLEEMAQENAQVDFSAIVNRINDLQNKFDELSKTIQSLQPAANAEQKDNEEKGEKISDVGKNESKEEEMSNAG